MHQVYHILHNYVGGNSSLQYFTNVYLSASKEKLSFEVGTAVSSLTRSHYVMKGEVTDCVLRQSIS